MNHKILMQVAAPAVLIGLTLTAACLVSAWYVNRLQTNVTAILAENVSSMHAAQQLEIIARQLRFHCFLYLIDPDPVLLRQIQADQRNFEEWLVRAEEVALTPREQVEVKAIREGYDRYRQEFDRLVHQAGPQNHYRALADQHPIRHVTDACREYLQTNQALMTADVQESSRVTERLHLALFLLAFGGPLGGILSGYGIARGLSRSLYRLSVRVQDMAQHLDRHVATVHLTPDGDLYHLDQQLEHVVARVGEIAEHMQRQQHEMLRAQQLAAVGQLAASVAHEVRNPLTSIKMLVEAAQRQNKPKPLTADTLRVVHGEIRRLEHTVQSFLDFARPPAPQRCPCDLRTVVRQAVELVRARARQQKVDIDAALPERPVRADVDAGQFCTVLVNLFINGLDAMPGGGRLRVTLSASPSAGIRLSVADTGAGIRPDVMGRLFTPFAGTKPTGSGLGLSISRRIVNEHGGTIDAVNLPVGGACFTITLPTTDSEVLHAGDPGR
jgi:two-component system sensor histidine kinase HydH